jgi:predicted SprT family Zn-dependent metalloprotease
MAISAPSASAPPTAIRDEIALNMKHFRTRTPAQILSTLVHEMTHLEQHHFGAPSRGGYHNKEWGMLMERVGLMPSDTGEVGGKRTGQRVSHYVVEGGAFDLAFKARTFVVPYFDRQEETETTRKKRKVAYTCPVCDDEVWGKPEVRVHCGKCGLVAMIAADMQIQLRGGPPRARTRPSLTSDLVALDVYEFHREGRLAEVPALVDWELVNYGTNPRPWWRCACGARRRFLYLKEGRIVCRGCAGLTYASRWVCRRCERALRRAVRLRKRLGADARPFADFPPPPKHYKAQRVYNRIVQEIALCEAEALGAFKRRRKKR